MISPFNNRLHLSWLCFWTVLGLSLGVVSAEVHTGPEELKQPSQTASAERIQAWIAQLDGDLFDERQIAQRQLEAVGAGALDAVTEVAKSGTLESSTRAINILLLWSEDEDLAFRFAALKKLASLTNWPRESAMATAQMALVREKTAYEKLTELGAEYAYDRSTRGINTPTTAIIFRKNWQGGYAALKYLEDVPNLTKISLYNAPLADAVFEHLTKLPDLERVQIFESQISQDAIKKFEQRMPNVAVEFRAGAFLGVRSDPRGSIISSVQPNTAAAKAGIKRGDRVTEFNGENVEDFAALTKRISRLKPGDSATLTVLRNKESMQIKVTFGDWGNAETPNRMPHSPTSNKNRRSVGPGTEGAPGGIPYRRR